MGLVRAISHMGPKLVGTHCCPHTDNCSLELVEKMGDKASPKVEEFENGFYGPYGKATEEQKALYDPILDSINNWFEQNWPWLAFARL